VPYSSLTMNSNMRASSEFSVTSPTQQDAPKKKGGRKAQFTVEARRQRNRDAQAAFRERRTEYIKELEEKVKIYSDKLRSIEAERSSNADDRLMLRYKNSLLEKILLNKGIDVNEELNLELGNPVMGSSRFHSIRRHGRHSLKHKQKTRASASGVSIQPPLLQCPISQDLSSVTTSPESEVLTPPALGVAPTHTKAKSNNARSGKYPHSFLLLYFKRTMVLD